MSTYSSFPRPNQMTILKKKKNAPRPPKQSVSKMQNSCICADKPSLLQVCQRVSYSSPAHRVPETTPQSQGLLESLTAKIINNLQVTVKNIHIRYEDKLSVPGVGSLMTPAQYVL
jgi:hypothetical protein